MSCACLNDTLFCFVLFGVYQGWEWCSRAGIGGDALGINGVLGVLKI